MSTHLKVLIIYRHKDAQSIDCKNSLLFIKNICPRLYQGLIEAKSILGAYKTPLVTSWSLILFLKL